jgi:hypothetical protein
LLPEGLDKVNMAIEIIRLAIISPKTLQYWTRERPRELIKLLDYKIYDVFIIVDHLLTDQISDKRSILFYELKLTQNYTEMDGYSIGDDNKLLKYLIGNSKRAEHLHVWRPIGEYVIKYLDDIYYSREIDIYNLPADSFIGEEKWMSPIFAGLHFFDLMVTTSIYQKNDSNMWLYYYYYFTKKIIRNCDLNKTYIKLDQEFPNKYFYLLYQIFKNLKNWILSIKYFDENENIIENAVFCITQCLNEIINSNRISKRFINYICEIVIGIYFDLRKNNKHDFAEVYLKKIISGDKYLKYNHKEKLFNILKNIDTIPWEMNDRIGWQYLNFELKS